jgi:hypothetical protein
MEMLDFFGLELRFGFLPRLRLPPSWMAFMSSCSNSPSASILFFGSFCSGGSFCFQLGRRLEQAQACAARQDE